MLHIPSETFAISGGLCECKGSATIYLDTSHNSTNMYEYPWLASILILVIAGTFIFILF